MTLRMDDDICQLNGIMYYGKDVTVYIGTMFSY